MNPDVHISVILPVRNGGTYLSAAVDSILHQTFQSFELLLIDDASSDGSIVALKSVAAQDSRLRIIRNPGSGLVDALNFGIAQSRADLIARMDADDVALPNRLLRQLEFMQVAPEIAIVGTQVAYIDSSGNPTGERSHFPTDPTEVAKALIDRGCVIRHPTVLARKASLLSVGCYRPACEKAEDYDLWLRLTNDNRIANLPDVLLQYRVHSAQVSNGINLQQRFSRDLALLSFRARATGANDALDQIQDPLQFIGADPNALDALPNSASLLLAYSALAFFEGRISTLPCAAALDAVVHCAHQGLLGDGRGYRARSLVRCAHLAAKTGNFWIATQAAKLALRLAPGKASRWLIGVGREASVQTA